jgi:hypothetical protein
MRCMVMRLDEKESLEYVKEQGFDLSRAQYYRIKKKIHDSRFDRLFRIAKGFVDHHLERMDTIDLVHHEMWTSYRKGDYKAMDALSKIAEIQPIISNYFDASKLVMEDEIERTKKEGQDVETKKQYNEWRQRYPESTHLDPCDIGLPVKTEAEAAAFRKRWKLDERPRSIKRV